MINPFQEFNCPYCNTENTLEVEITGGNFQKLITDCEICCRPIVVEIELAGEEVYLNVYPEND